MTFNDEPMETRQRQHKKLLKDEATPAFAAHEKSEQSGRALVLDHSFSASPLLLFLLVSSVARVRHNNRRCIFMCQKKGSYPLSFISLWEKISNVKE